MQSMLIAKNSNESISWEKRSLHDDNIIGFFVVVVEIGEESINQSKKKFYRFFHHLIGK